MSLTGQVGIVTHAQRWSIGWWVEQVTHSPAHHVIIAISNTVAVSAEPHGVRYRNISDYPHITWTRYDLTQGQRTMLAWFADGHVGINYNMAAFTALGIHYLTGIPIPAHLAERLNTRRHVTCSQLAADIYRNLTNHPHPTATVVAPAHWWDLATTEGWTRT